MKERESRLVESESLTRRRCSVSLTRVKGESLTSAVELVSLIKRRCSVSLTRVEGVSMTRVKGVSLTRVEGVSLTRDLRCIADQVYF